MLNIIPAILEKDKKSTEQCIRLLNNRYKNVQIDICDGVFVVNKSYSDIKSIAELAVIYNKNISLDIMINIKGFGNKKLIKFINDINKNINQRMKEIIIHYSSFKNIEDMDYFVRNINKKVNLILAIRLDDDMIAINKVLEEYYKNRNLIKGLQIMGIRNIGKQGEVLDDIVYKKIKYIRERFGLLYIQIDGGVKLHNVDRVRLAGANAVMMGSQIFSGDVKANLKEINNYKKSLKNITA
ncbi:MAG: hypothetical protein QM532_03480 [Cyanobium sp. MAG06]|nr:hypothetical protein [Cyanobium sp. MAG06]